MKIAENFCKENSRYIVFTHSNIDLSANKEVKLKLVIQKQLAGVLTKIQEEESDY
jgi:hypothetical protein